VGFFDDLFGFAKQEAPVQAQTDTVRKIVDALDRMDSEHARYLAAFAYILSRVARADLKVSPNETRSMEQKVMEHGKLSEEQAILVVQIAKHQNLLFGATEDFLVTREFSKISTPEQKLALIDCLFSVAAAEDLVSVIEDNEIRQISREVGLSHAEFISVRTQHRNSLAVFRRDDDPPQAAGDADGAVENRRESE
jgi:uncharacterized tellurite resistance protein B-like protein